VIAGRLETGAEEPMKEDTMKHIEKNILRNALTALQVLAISNADEYLQELAERALEILEAQPTPTA